MNTRDLESVQSSRWPAIAGIAFVILVVVGFAMLSNTPDTATAPVDEWTAWYRDSGNRTSQLIGAYLFALSGLAFLAFIWGLSRRLSYGEDGGLHAFVFASGTVLSAIILTTIAPIAAISAGAQFGGDQLPNGEIARTIEQIGFTLFFISGALTAAVTMAATAAGVYTTGTLPRWLVWVSVVLAVVVLFSPFFFPIIALPVWALIVSIVLLIRASK